MIQLQSKEAIRVVERELEKISKHLGIAPNIVREMLVQKWSGK